MLLALRDEAHRAQPCLAALAAQTGLDDVEFLVLDDDSRDATAALVASVLGADPRLRLIRGHGDPPPGFLGKPWACARLAEAADPRSTVLVFLDADVVLAPEGLARTVALLRAARLDLVSPYPRQIAGSPAERLVQPLLTWSWLTLVPLRLAERSRRPSLAIANGQLLAVDAASYRAAGGHAAPGVRTAVMEDIALARAMRRHGFAGGMADGTQLATCRMYDGWPALRDGYAKSLWAAAGGRRSASAGQLALLGWLYAASGLAVLPGRGRFPVDRGPPDREPRPAGRVRSSAVHRPAERAHGPLLAIAATGGAGLEGPSGGHRRPRVRGVGTAMVRIVVIGAGVGGLAAAARLRALGHDVTVCERAPQIGGKLGTYARDGFRFDTGPSLLTMPAVFEDLFAATGDPLAGTLDLRRVDPHCHYRFDDGAVLDLPASREALAGALRDSLGAQAAQEWERLQDRAGRMWSVSRETFVESPGPRDCSNSPRASPRSSR